MLSDNVDATRVNLTGHTVFDHKLNRGQEDASFLNEQQQYCIKIETDDWLGQLKQTSLNCVSNN